MLMIPLPGMKMMVQQILPGQLQILLLMLMKHIVFLQRIWMAMAIWIFFLHQEMMIKFTGMKTMVQQIHPGRLQLLLPVQMLPSLFLQQMWIMMAIWIFFLHQDLMMPLPGMIMMVRRILPGRLQILLPALIMQHPFL